MRNARALGGWTGISALPERLPGGRRRYLGTESADIRVARRTREFETKGHAAVSPQLLADFEAVVTCGLAPPPALATGRDGLMAQIIVDEANRQSVRNGDACRTADGVRGVGCEPTDRG